MAAKELNAMTKECEPSGKEQTGLSGTGERENCKDDIMADRASVIGRVDAVNEGVKTWRSQRKGLAISSGSLGCQIL